MQILDRDGIELQFIIDTIINKDNLSPIVLGVTPFQGEKNVKNKQYADGGHILSHIKHSSLGRGD
jgi:hypothetical protein